MTVVFFIVLPPIDIGHFSSSSPPSEDYIKKNRVGQIFLEFIFFSPFDFSCVLKDKLQAEKMLSSNGLVMISSLVSLVKNMI
jgi:hypothetical protein